MKTRKHGNGLSHNEVVRFSNRLAAIAKLDNESELYNYTAGFNRGYAAACRYFAHELRKELRHRESMQDY